MPNKMITLLKENEMKKLILLVVLIGMVLIQGCMRITRDNLDTSMWEDGFNSLNAISEVANRITISYIEGRMDDGKDY